MLRHSLLLAALLHLWLALLVGTEPADAPTQGGWGRLTVTLLGPRGGATGATGPATPLWRDDGPPGVAPTPRHGGRLREQPAAADSEPGAQALGRWRAQAVEPEPSRVAQDSPGRLGAHGPASPTPEPPAPAQAARPEPAPAPMTPPEPAPLEVPPPPPVQPQPEPPRLSSPQPPRTESPRAERIPALAEAAAPAPPWLQALPTQAPAVLADLREPPPSQRPRTEALQALPQTSAAPLLAPPDLAPKVPQRLDAPAPAPRPRSERLDAARLPTPPSPLTAPVVPARAPALLDAAPAPALPALQTERLAPVPQAQVPTSELRATPGQVELPTSARQDLPANEPGEAAPPVRRELPSASAPRLRPQVEALPGLATPSRSADAALNPSPREAPTTPAAATDPSAPPGVDPLADPSATRPDSPRASPGSPEAGARVGHDQATAPSAAASRPLAPLDLRLPPRSLAAGPVRQSSGLVNLLPAPPLPKTKMEKALDEASREDCRKAHADAGLLGALPLAADSARGKGCRW